MVVLVTVPGNFYSLFLDLLPKILTVIKLGLSRWNILISHWFNNGMLLEMRLQSKLVIAIKMDISIDIL